MEKETFTRRMLDILNVIFPYASYQQTGMFR